MKTNKIICDHCETHYDEADESDLITVVTDNVDEYVEMHFCDWHCLSKYSTEKSLNKHK